jgi:hypothetical protein
MKKIEGHIGEKKKWARNCPKCNDVIFSKSKYYNNNAIKNKNLCHRCANARIKKPTYRFCPDCGKKLQHKGKTYRIARQNCLAGIRNNKLCKSCMQRGNRNNSKNPEIVKKIKETLKNIYSDPNNIVVKKIIESQTGMNYDDYIKSLPERDKYVREVKALTEKTIRREKIKDIEKRSYEFPVDHIVSILFGFKNNIDPKLLASKENLRIITREENISKFDTLTSKGMELLKRWKVYEFLTEKERKHYEIT